MGGLCFETGCYAALLSMRPFVSAIYVMA